MKTESATPETRAFYLPDFCTSRVTLAVVLIVELTALVITLASNSDALDFWTDLARISLFLLWIGLSSAALLCWIKRRLQRLTITQVSIAVLSAIAALILTISALTFSLGQSATAIETGVAGLFPTTFWSFAWRNILIGCIVTGLMLRYFYVLDQWRYNIDLQARARVHALQARIRPHFLFNSMNTIASLTRSNPARAETAILDMADLFRANLSEQRNTLTLAEEVAVAQTYQRMEQLRLGERLHVEWHIDSVPQDAWVPGLLLQPLLENAIYYGVEPVPAGGTVWIKAEITGELITIVIRNRVAGHNSRQGNKLALANIRERLSLMYGEKALVKAGQFEDEYIVTLRFPYVQKRERLPL
jgi:two-component system, LytTR family, sensor histidine kinase AlgZ